MKNVMVAICGVLVMVFLISLVVDIFNPQYGFFAKVQAGRVGIVDKMGKVKDEALQPGFHVTGFFEKVVEIDARVQKVTVELAAFSSDIQQTNIATSVNFNIQAEKAGTLYKTIGMNYVQNLIIPRLLENVKVTVGNYTAETLIENREDISIAVLEKMKKDMEPYGINVTVISIENIDFTDAFEAAVEAKQVATQEKKKAQTMQEQQTMEAEQEAKRNKIKAEAAADVVRTKADAEAYEKKVKAEAEAEANRKISETLTEDLIGYTKAQRWDGKLPYTYVGADDAVPIIQAGADLNPFIDDLEETDDQ